MYRMILYTHWKWSRLIVVLGVLAGFAVPLLSVQEAGSASIDHVQAGELLAAITSWGVLYPALAATLGLLVAITAWGPDHRGRHVYALSLPIPRWRYALLRFGAGAALLGAPVLAVGVGAVLATAIAKLPPGLHGYPLALTLRFALAVLIAYAIFFAVAAGTARTAGLVLGAIGVVLVVQVLAFAAGIELHLLDTGVTAVLNFPGPFAIFSGRWMLIDV